MSRLFPFAEEPHHPVTRPGCVGMSALKVHADEDLGLAVVHLRFDPGGEMDEHDARHPILFVVITGDGLVRMGGEESAIRSGESSFWPAGVLHKVTAGANGLTAISIEYGLSLG